jgi:hypothetical protein
MELIFEGWTKHNHVSTAIPNNILAMQTQPKIFHIILSAVVLLSEIYPNMKSWYNILISNSYTVFCLVVCFGALFRYTFPRYWFSLRETPSSPSYKPIYFTRLISLTDYHSFILSLVLFIGSLHDSTFRADTFIHFNSTLWSRNPMG